MSQQPDVTVYNVAFEMPCVYNPSFEFSGYDAVSAEAAGMYNATFGSPLEGSHSGHRDSGSMYNPSFLNSDSALALSA
jgi:hypothetical protein